VSDTVISDQGDGEYDPLAVFQAMATGPSSEELYGKFADLRVLGPLHRKLQRTLGVIRGRRRGSATPR
jgi:hypothetical protein